MQSVGSWIQPSLWCKVDSIAVSVSVVILVDLKNTANLRREGLSSVKLYCTCFQYSVLYPIVFSFVYAFGQNMLLVFVFGHNCRGRVAGWSFA